MTWTVIDITRNSEAKRRVAALITPLKGRLKELKWKQNQLATKANLSQSTVSRALSGRVLPPFATVDVLVKVLGLDKEEFRLRWRAASAAVGAQRIRDNNGEPPHFRDYPDLLQGLRNLLATQRLSQRALVDEVNDRGGSLRRSTVGAQLGGRRSLHRETVEVIVDICGVPEPSAVKWLAAWDRLGAPHMAEQLRRRDEACRRLGTAQARVMHAEQRRRRNPWYGLDTAM
ncbi:helix-turn-helix transcriptional regulator [Streptosporangium sp. NPDC000563]|uniref:helix-turn-helix domain-containing protein n=1 Tax=Streptosporangium sp. NPDC000563 TaxID=3154366 RepID=UPI00332DA196